MWWSRPSRATTPGCTGGRGCGWRRMGRVEPDSGDIARTSSSRSATASSRPTELMCRRPSRAERAADVVVLDPPRKGAGRDVVTRIAAAGPRSIVYVACDPSALARDAATLRDLGYRLEDLRAFDLFPMTAHVECLALFTRNPAT